MTPSDQSEIKLQLLAVRCQLGEPDALDELVQAWHLALWKYLRRLVADSATAEDLLQEVWLRIVRGFPKLRDPTRLVPWMFRIARYTALDQMRRKYAVAERLEPETGDVVPVLNPLANEEKEALLHEGLLELPWIEREVLTLFYLQELSLSQVAEIIEIPEGTVKSRLYRARQMLKRRLLQKGIEP